MRIWTPPKKEIALPKLQRGFFTLPGGMGGIRPGGSPISYATWNPSDKSSNISLSSGNRLAQSSTTLCAVRALYGKSSGKWYCEAQLGLSPLAGYQFSFGVGNASASLSQYCGQNANSWAYVLPGSSGFNAGGYTNNVVSPSNAAYNTGSPVQIGLALDMDNGGLLSFRLSSGAWMGGGDPAAGTATIFTIGAGTFYVMCGGAASQACLICADPATWTLGSAPSGFSAISA